MQTGKVKWFNVRKGYGLIEPADGSDDVFVFYPSIEAEGFKTLEAGQAVSFHASWSGMGWKTERVVKM